MKNFRKLSIVFALVAASATYASADTLQLGSFATGASSLGNQNTAMNFAGYQATSSTPSTGTGTSFLLNPSTVWAPAIAGSTWVGSTPTSGPVGTLNPALGFYTYTTNFTAATQQQYYGSMTILADDTAEVFLNGSVLIPFGTLGSDAHCADVAPTCLTPLTTSIALTSLLSGVNANTLTFVVRQQGVDPVGGTGNPAGLDFNGSFTAVPEPSSLIMLGTGLFGSAGILLLRMRS